ncbi:MFS transporter [Salinarimonas sp.]|uniref:MFS transporter n=1 Tax=Salinarimonas sp. TaxID=2766526 RepID=UPI0032D917B5
MSYLRLAVPDIASPTVRTSVFLAFLFLSLIGTSFVTNSFKFAAFEITQSKSVVSLIGSVSAVAFIVLGLFAGVIVDAISRKFFVQFQLIAVAAMSFVFFAFFEAGYVSILWLFAFIIAHEIIAAFANAAKHSVFFDLCGSDQIARWVSRRGIVMIAASMSASLLLTFFVSDEAFLFAIYAVILLMALAVFRVIGYQDQNKAQRFSSVREAVGFVLVRLKDFVRVCRGNRALMFLFLFSFLKTVFIFWPMASGALFKFGIEDDATRRVYLIAAVIMDVISMASLYALGRKKSYTNASFVAGAAISGLGIFLFSLADTTVLAVLTLAIMYVGLAVSQVSSTYILRMELPEDHRTQGLGFAVVPYYFADIVSGIVFAFLVVYVSVDDLLFWTGALLTVLATALFVPLARAKA